jgi:clan AA aspartic protease (TIGR02281 family)
MERRFLLWFGYPFIGLTVTVLALGVLGLVNWGILFVLLIALVAAGTIAGIVHAILRIRAGDSWAEALNPLATMVVLAGLSYGTNFLAMGQSPRTGPGPSAEVQQSPGIRLATIQDGHFRSMAVIGDQTVPFIVDFKTEHLLLKSEDAERLGIDTASLAYDRDIMIGGRTVKGAMVTLPNLQIASASISNTAAIVIADRLPENVIGMRPLLQFGDWHIEPAGLILSPPTEAE